ncbi:hypothetical protein Bca52824_033232 [Brassica carinata]|uniref:DUF4283 domain-containing protein n=1 Tax=Brassica carinata TaxID=52824 RepID=A0A8X7V995_BRACI|nr:hypothetical protein Bca52824_033232 [Brassica carinata]
MSNRKDLASSQGDRIQGSSSNQVVHRLDVEEDEIIKLPACDLEAAAEQFKLTLIGRVFQLKSRSIDALINLLPKPRIWNVEGRVRGTNLGNGRFQFDFDNEQDLQAVFALERWEPFTSEDFPNSIPFWISVTGVPVHFWNDGTFSDIARALGKKLTLDSKRAKMFVSINVDNPLEFKRRVGFPNGDIGRVYPYYISHDEKSCPLLTVEKREQRRLQRLEMNTNGDRKLQLEFPGGLQANNRKRPRSPPSEREVQNTQPPISRREDWREDKRQRQLHHGKKDYSRSYHGDAQQNLAQHHPRVSGRNNYQRTEVWNRIELSHKPRDCGSMPRHKSSSSQHDRDNHRSNFSNRARSEWRPRSHLPMRHDGDPRRSDVRSAGQSGIADSRLDSRRTISERLNGLEQGEIPSGKDAEQLERRRLKGKAIVSETPTSKEKDRRTWNAITNPTPFSIREPSERLQSSIVRVAATKDQNDPHKDIQSDMEIDKADEEAFNAMIMTKGEFDEVDKSVKEFEQLEMDAEMIDNDDLLGEEPERDAVQIEALSQLSPAHAEYQEEPQDGQQLTSDRRTRKNESSLKTARTKDQTSLRVLKRRIPKSPVSKGSKASKKLSAAHGRNSPKVKQGAATSKKSAPSSRKVPRHEVFPSAISKNSLSLSGSVVSQKPSSKRI